ncbi:hypothetical protein GOBAR_AA27612 [Gossypium barbadense]|uniref:Ionotropic glutamate receptor C-terminal domain-containing protein n=1 Tax=Gossypium barbadense TaxID=3634 RepID=A0A2P5WPQ2_GOSBA|nr:hypothetical protein GOBAR_AA27612 [Gossypium barbadense]
MLYISYPAFYLLEKAKVKVILISAQKSTLDTKVLAEFGNQTKIPVISISSSTIDDDLNTLLWPGGTSTITKGRMMQTRTNKTLKIAVPKSNGFPQLLKVDPDLQTNTTIFLWLLHSCFRSCNSGFEVWFVTILSGSFMPLAFTDCAMDKQKQKYDGAVGDITINANRSFYVDFTMPFTDIGVGMVTRLTPKDNQNLWIFLKPLTPGLWLTIVGAYVLATFVIWLIERPALAKQQTQQSNGQIGRMISFSFSILVFAQWEKLTSNLSRSVVVLWVFEMFIVGSNYTATLTSMLTVQHIEFISKVDNIGHRLGPVTQEVVGILNIQNSSSTSKWLTSPAEFEKALSEGSKNGGFSAIIDEMPYINVFLEKYSTHYSMVGPVNRTTNGFGFVFSKGSTLARDISREIAKLREDGRLEMLENVWFKSSTTNFDSRDTFNISQIASIQLTNPNTESQAQHKRVTSKINKRNWLNGSKLHVMTYFMDESMALDGLGSWGNNSIGKSSALAIESLKNTTYFSLVGKLSGFRPAGSTDEIDVGLIVDMGSREGKIIHSYVSMTVSDFYSLHRDYQMRIGLHTRDSKGDTLLALSAESLIDLEKIVR